MSRDWTMHIGRSFTGTRIEDTCPCEKAPCGLVDTTGIHPDCTQHPWQRGNTIRQSHQPGKCPIEKIELAPDGAKKEATL